jgi:hypothetical protein
MGLRLQNLSMQSLEQNPEIELLSEENSYSFKYLPEILDLNVK